MDAELKKFKKQIRHGLRILFNYALDNIAYKKECGVMAYMVPPVLEKLSDELNNYSETYMGKFKDKDFPKVH